MQIFVYVCVLQEHNPCTKPQQYCTLFSDYYKDKQLLITVQLFCKSVLTAAE